MLQGLEGSRCVAEWLVSCHAQLDTISRATCRSWRLPPQDAADLRQEVALRLLMLASSGRAPDSHVAERGLYAWLRAVAQRIARDMAREGRRAVDAGALPRVDAIAPEARPDPAATPSSGGLIDVYPLLLHPGLRLGRRQLEAVHAMLQGPPSHWAQARSGWGGRNQARSLAGAARRLRRIWRSEAGSWAPASSTALGAGRQTGPAPHRARVQTCSRLVISPGSAPEIRANLGPRAQVCRPQRVQPTTR